MDLFLTCWKKSYLYIFLHWGMMQGRNQQAINSVSCCIQGPEQGSINSNFLLSINKPSHSWKAKQPLA